MRQHEVIEDLLKTHTHFRPNVTRFAANGAFVFLDFFTRRLLSGPPSAYRPVEKKGIIVVVSILSIADSHDLEDQSLVAVVRNAKAVTQITVSLYLTWPAPEQRKRVYKISNYSPET